MSVLTEQQIDELLHQRQAAAEAEKAFRRKRRRKVRLKSCPLLAKHKSPKDCCFGRACNLAVMHIKHGSNCGPLAENCKKIKR